MGLELRVKGLGFGLEGLEIWFQGSGTRVKGLGSWVLGLWVLGSRFEFGIQGFGTFKSVSTKDIDCRLRYPGLAFWVQGSGFRVLGQVFMGLALSGNG